MGCNGFSSEILVAWALLGSARFLCRSACKQRSWLCSQACYKLAVNCPSTSASLSHGHNSVLLHLCISRAEATGLGKYSADHRASDHLRDPSSPADLPSPCTQSRLGEYGRKAHGPCQRLKFYGLNIFMKDFCPLQKKCITKLHHRRPPWMGLPTESLDCELNP